MSNPAPTLNQINAFNATIGTTIDFNIIGGTEVIRSNRIYIYDLSDNSLICTHLYVSTEPIHELPPNTSTSIVYESGKSSADFTNNTQYYAQIQTYTDTNGTQGASGLSVAKLFWCLPTPTLTLATIPTTISTTSYNVSATYTPNTSGSATNEIQEFQFNLYSAIGALLQTSGVVLYGEGVDLSYNFSGLEVDSTYYVTLDVTTTQGMNVSAQSDTFTVSIDTPTMGSASVVNNACDGYISVTSNLSGDYSHEQSVDAGEVMSFTTDSPNNIKELQVDFHPIQDGTPWMSQTPDTTPYLFRASPQLGHSYNSKLPTIVGGSVVGNQKLTNGNFANGTNGWTTTNGTLTASDNVGSFVASAFNGFANITNLSAISGRVYVTFADVKVSSGVVQMNCAWASKDTTQTGVFETVAVIWKSAYTGNNLSYPRFYDRRTSGWDAVLIKNVHVHDLTAMLGTSIADRAYAMEQAQAGSGIAWLKSYGFISDSYEAYDTGTLKSVEATAHKTTGKNWLGGEALADAIKEAIPQAVIDTANKTVSYASGYSSNTSFTDGLVFSENTQYTIIIGFSNTVARTNMLVRYTDGTTQIIPTTNTGRQTIVFTTSAGKTVSSIGGSNNDGTSVIYYDETGIFVGVLTASDFEPYTSHTYPLANVTLRGIPKVDANDNIYYDGDLYPPSGQVDRRYAEIILDGSSDEDWAYTGGFAYCRSLRGTAKAGAYSVIPNVVCDKLETVAYGNAGSKDYWVSMDNTKDLRIHVGTAITDVASARTWLASNPITVVYELATPTTETADPFQSPQIVDPNGTEEYVGSPIPVGHKTTYQRICPISGWDSVDAYVTGVNVWDEQWELGSYDGSGQPISINTVIRTKNYISVFPSTGYYILAPYNGVVYYYDATKTFISLESFNANGTVKTTPTSCRYVRFRMASDYGTTYNHDISINYPSTDHSYHAYQGTTYTSTFPKYKQQVTQDKTPYITKDIGDTYADTLTENLVGGTIAWNQSVPDTTTTHTISGSIASMDDAVAGNFESVVCDIEPLQDLHGYDKPWVGGAGVNLWQPFSGTGRGVTFTPQDDGTVAISGTVSIDGWPQILKDYTLTELGWSVGDSVYVYIDRTEQIGSAIRFLDSGGTQISQIGNNTSGTVPEGTATVRFIQIGARGTAPSAGDVINTVGHFYVCRGTTAPTTWTPYENLCPITGWTGCEVDVAGKNLFNPNSTSKEWVKTNNNITTASDCKANRIKVNAGEKITLSNSNSASATNILLIACCDANENVLSRNVASASGVYKVTAIAPANTAFAICAFYTWSASANQQVEYGGTQTDYEAYAGTTYPVSWQTEAGTVYGGYLDVVSGVLTVNYGIVDLGSLSYTYVSTANYQYFWANVSGMKSISSGTMFGLSDRFDWKGVTTTTDIQNNPDNTIGTYNGQVRIKCTSYTDKNAFKTAMNGAQFCYELAQTQTYQLDPVQVACLLGHNNVWNNISDTTVTYPTNHSYQSLSTTHKYYKRINGVESISVGSDVVADVGTDNIIDLTQMFGTTIADYIYNREQSSSSGMGVKFFKSLFPNDDYDYNSGTLISVNASAHVIKDANGNVLHTYPLDSDLVLRGIPKLDANNKLYYDGDVYEPSGGVTRKYGIVDLGTLTWYWSATYEVFYANIGNQKVSLHTAIPNAVCDSYPTMSFNALDVDHTIQKGFTMYKNSESSNGYVDIRDTSKDGMTSSQFKQSMSGVYVVYELATPTTEIADPFEENQAIVPNGVEEYIVTEQGDVEMPVGHDSTYYATEVYGGTIDMAKGVLTITHAMTTYDGTESWTWESSNTRAWIGLNAMDRKENYIGSLICDKLPTAIHQASLSSTGITGYQKTSAYQGQNWLYVKVDGVSTASDFTTWLTNNPITVCYELATPIEISLTPQQMQTLSGQNNIWSNTNGGMYLVYQLPITDLLVKRKDVSQVGSQWLTLHSVPVEQASDMDFTYIDFLNQYGKKYQYALVPVLAQDQSGVIVQIEGGYTVSDNVDSIFDGVYIADQTNVERVKAGVGYGNIDMNQGVGSITPIGSKYPIVITNSQNQYHNGSIRGTIVPNDFYSNGNLSRIDMVNKRDELEQFLTNKRAKIIKDWNGKMWLVMIMSNVACSFDDNYGMGMVSFSADWLEVGDPTNQQDLYNAGLINVGGV